MQEASGMEDLPGDPRDGPGATRVDGQERSVAALPLPDLFRMYSFIEKHTEIIININYYLLSSTIIIIQSHTIPCVPCTPPFLHESQ